MLCEPKDRERNFSSIKISRMDGHIINVKAEYEDCKTIAEDGRSAAHNHKK